MVDVRECIKPAIEAAGLKQIAVAKKINFTEQQLSDVVNKRRKLDSNELLEICHIIGVSPNELLEYGVESKEKDAG